MQSVYYLHHFLWRISRAASDKAFGRYRVGLLLLIAEVNVTLSVAAVLLRKIGEPLPRTLILPIVLVAYFTALNGYLFRPSDRMSAYHARFRGFSAGRRRAWDFLSAVVFLAAVFSPLAVGPWK